MTNRLTPEALDALLAEHRNDGDENCQTCLGPRQSGYRPVPWPCTIYLLASEVRDARPVRDAAIAYVLGYSFKGDDLNQESLEAYQKRAVTEEEELWAAVAHYEEGTK